MIKYFKIILGLILILNCFVKSQTFTDQGIGSGSSIILLPTGSIAPASGFRLQTNHFTFFKNHSFTSVDITGGFSTYLEFYLKYSAEINNQPLTSNVSGFGAKFRLPFDVPFIYRAAIWGERITAENILKNYLFTADLTRFGLVTSVYTNAFEPTIFIGFNKTKNYLGFLGSFGATYSISRNYKLGLEFTYGYFGNHDYTGLFSLTSRIFANMSAQITGGYIAASSIKSWTVSAGISLTTFPIDFSPRREIEIKEGIPSFDEIMKSIEEKEQLEKSKQEGKVSEDD